MLGSKKKYANSWRAVRLGGSFIFDFSIFVK